MRTPWAPGAGVLSCEAADGVTLLNLKTGRYFHLNRTAGLIWSRLAAGDTANCIIDDPQELVSIAKRNLTEQVRQSVEQFMTLHLLFPNRPGDMLIPSTTPAAAPKHRASTLPSLPQSIVVLTRVILYLQFAGFGSSLRRFAGASTVTSATAVSADLTKLTRKVSIAASTVPFRAKCLEQSLCLTYLARRAGVDARLRLGVLPAPFEGHAWVEFQGVPINDSVDNLRLYRPFVGLDDALGLRPCSS